MTVFDTREESHQTPFKNLSILWVAEFNEAL